MSREQPRQRGGTVLGLLQGPGLWLAVASGFAIGLVVLAIWATLPPNLPRQQPPMAGLSPPSAGAKPAPSSKVAALPPPALPRPQAEPPPWRRFAVAAPPSQGRPRIAIVIDDLGVDRRRTERTIALKGPLTLSFLAYAADLPHLTQMARRAGHELLVHVPMQPMSSSEDMGPNGLAVGLSKDELLRRLNWDLGRFEGYVGINNHMGSRFTSDTASMLPVMQELKARGLLFLDSRTIASTAGTALAERLGVPNAARDVFLDNEVNANGITERLAVVEATARRKGTAIAIGHPHDATLAQLAVWLDSFARKNLVLVPVSAIVRERYEAEGRG